MTDDDEMNSTKHSGMVCAHTVFLLSPVHSTLHCSYTHCCRSCPRRMQASYIHLRVDRLNMSIHLCHSLTHNTFSFSFAPYHSLEQQAATRANDDLCSFSPLLPPFSIHSFIRCHIFSFNSFSHCLLFSSPPPSPLSLSPPRILPLHHYAEASSHPLLSARRCE